MTPASEPVPRAEPFPILVVPDDAPLELEQLGTKEKFWFRDAATDRMGLFKKTRSGTGEDWAECVAAEVAHGLELPHAEYDLAVHRGARGAVSWQILGRHQSLLHGNEILSRGDRRYPLDNGPRATRRNALHTVRRVMRACSRVGVPASVGCDVIARGDDVMVGYLMFDALIGNTDRHHQNWGWVLDLDEARVFVAPTFDHASSLGRNEPDERRRFRLETRDVNGSVEAYALRARAGLFESSSGGAAPSALRTIDAFRDAARMRPKAAQVWLRRLEVVADEELRRIAFRVPRACGSELASEFAGTMLCAMRSALLKMEF